MQAHIVILSRSTQHYCCFAIFGFSYEDWQNVWQSLSG